MNDNQIGLNGIFRPKNILIVGASNRPGKVGYELVSNLIKNGYSGKIYPVNPKGGEVLGFKIYTSLEEIKDKIDLALIAISADIVPNILEELGHRGVKAAIIFSSGFSEAGNVDLENRVIEIAQRYNIRIVGPNCAGIVNWMNKLYASFVPNVKPGDLGLISQSGAFTAIVMEYMRNKQLGLSLLVSYGNRVDVKEYELLEYFSDSDIRSFMIYLEGLWEEEGKRLAYTLKNVLKKKPVVILKAGRGEAGLRAVRSHTGALAGDYKIYYNILTGLGVSMVDEYYELVDVAEALAYLPKPSNNNVLIITNSGGPGAILVDQLFMEGINIRKTPSSLKNKLSFLPSYMSKENPIDITASGLSDIYYNVLHTALKDPWSGIIISIYVPPSFANPIDLAKAIRDSYLDSRIKKPLIPLFLGPKRKEAYRIFWRMDDRLPTPHDHRSTAKIVSSILNYYRE